MLPLESVGVASPELLSDEFELFDDFYEFQNNVRLDEEQKEIIKEIIEQAKK